MVVRLAAVDPSLRSTGVAIFEGLALMRAWLHVGQTGPDLALRVRISATGLADELAKYKASRVVIERPRTYHGRAAKGSTQDLLDLSVYVGALAQACVDRGIEPQLILPQTWKGSAPKEITSARTIAALDPSESAVIMPCPASLRHNVLDAIGIGLSTLCR
jgi:hypothetical protein